MELHSLLEASVWLLTLCWRAEKLERDAVLLGASLTELPAPSALTRDGGSWHGLVGRCTSMAAVVIMRVPGSGTPMSATKTRVESFWLNISQGENYFPNIITGINV